MGILRLLILLEKMGVSGAWRDAGHVVYHLSARDMEAYRKWDARATALVLKHREVLLRHLRTAAQAGEPSLADDGGG